jgi:hypothetical protein
MILEARADLQVVSEAADGQDAIAWVGLQAAWPNIAGPSHAPGSSTALLTVLERPSASTPDATRSKCLAGGPRTLLVLEGLTLENKAPTGAAAAAVEPPQPLRSP